MVTEALKKLLPTFPFDAEPDLNYMGKEALLEASKKYGLNYDTNTGELKYSSEEVSLLIRYDLNEKLELVFEARQISYCPELIMSSGYHSSVSKALKALAKLI
jgi:hypothetical protein